MEAPFILNGQEVFIRSSIGFSVYPEAGLTPELLLQQADAVTGSGVPSSAGPTLFCVFVLPK